MLTSCPPSTPPVSNAVRRPSRALVNAAVRPANPPPMTTTSYSLLIACHTGKNGCRLPPDASVSTTASAQRGCSTNAGKRNQLDLLPCAAGPGRGLANRKDLVTTIVG